MSSRTLVAAAASSTAIVAVIGIGLYLGAGALLGWDMIPEGSLSHSMFFFFFFGWPVALVVILIAATIGGSLIDERKIEPSLRSVLIPSAVLGAVGTSLAWFVFWHSTDEIAQVGGLGLIAGLVGGALFWAIWRPRPI